MTNGETRWCCCNVFSREVLKLRHPQNGDQKQSPLKSETASTTLLSLILKVKYFSSLHLDNFSGCEQLGKSHSSPHCLSILAPFLPINLYKHDRQIARIKLRCSRRSIKQRSKDIFYYLSPCLKGNNGRLISYVFSFTNSPDQGFLLFHVAFFSH